MATSHAQCWFLLAFYEATRAYFTRAFMSVGRCVSLVQMMSLHLLDSPNDDEHVFKKGDWTEREEGRRVFWGAYLGDRWASSLSGHPVTIRDEDVSAWSCVPRSLLIRCNRSRYMQISHHPIHRSGLRSKALECL